MTPKKPSWFKTRDLLQVGLPAGVLLVSAFFSFLYRDILHIPLKFLEFYGASFIGALGLLAIYAVIAVRRYSELKPYLYLPGNDYALMLNLGDYTGGTPTDVLREFDRTLGMWVAVFGVRDIRTATKGTFWITFTKGERHPPGRGEPSSVGGHRIAAENRLRVSYQDPQVSIEKTDLAHEIGHILQYSLFGDWNERKHHLKAHRFGLP